MATGALSSLGIGSNGTLSYDIIDQLKEADKASLVTPIERDIVEVNEKQSSLATLKSQLSSFSDAVEELSSETLFAQRDVSVTGDSVGVTVDPGVDIQDMNIEVTQLAQKDVYESDTSFPTTASSVASGATTMEINAGGVVYSIDVDENTSLEELRDKINEKAGARVTASILDTGQANPYSLVIKADESGLDNALSITDTNGTMNTTFGNIQTAQDATFKYNGVEIKRGSNEVDDLIQGVHLTLLEENDPGKTTNIEITRDNSGLKGKMEDFVSQYNALIGQLDELTKYDPETGETGIFQGESTINRLKSDITHIMTYTDADATGLRNFGLNLDEYGKISLDDEEWDEAIDEMEIEDIEQFFVGDYEEIYGEERLVDGVFTQFEETVNEYTSFADGIFKYFGDQLENEESSLTKEREKAVQRLDQRYETMAARFAAYDEQISNMNSSFQSLSMQIEQSLS